MTRSVYLSLGSNLGDREDNLRKAVKALGRGVRITAISSVYETAPVGGVEQPDFLNLAISGKTEVGPEHLLSLIKEIECDLGRKATVRWGPRVVDIDIVLYDDLILETEDLTIPHREMANRAFVLAPLAEIAPKAVHPGLCMTVEDLWSRLSEKEGIRVLGPYRAS